MKRLLTLCIVLTAVALIAGPVFAEVQNVKVSGDIRSAGVYRNAYDLFNSGNSNRDDGVNEGDNYNFLYTQARVRVDADLTDNVSATIRYLTEWDWNTEDSTYSSADNVDLDLANVTLKEVFYGPLTVIVGRQELRYGNAFIIGDPDTNTTSKDGDLSATDMSLRKSFDAVRAILDFSPLTVDVIFAKIDETSTTPVTVTPKDDEDLYGVNAAYQLDSYDAEVEAYWFLNRDDNETAWGRGGGETADAASPGHEIHTIGVRGSMTPVDNLNLLGEVAWQRGKFDKTTEGTKRDQDAYAFQVAGDYSIIDMAWEPVVRLGYTHYSGEEEDDTGDQEAWIPLYEDQTHGVVANYILGGINGGQNSNAGILNVGASVMPIEDLTVSLDYYKFWLDEKLESGSNTAPAAGDRLDWVNITESEYLLNADDDLGYEIDLALNYDYTEDVKMGLSAGWFIPGGAFDGSSSTDTNNETATQVMATLDVAF